MCASIESEMGRSVIWMRKGIRLCKLLALMLRHGRPIADDRAGMQMFSMQGVNTESDSATFFMSNMSALCKQIRMEQLHT